MYFYFKSVISYNNGDKNHHMTYWSSYGYFILSD